MPVAVTLFIENKDLLHDLQRLAFGFVVKKTNTHIMGGLVSKPKQRREALPQCLWGVCLARRNGGAE